MNCTGITAVVTFHREGLVAHRSLGSILRSCLRAESAGVQNRLVIVLDNADDETRRVVERHPLLRRNDQIFHLSCGDVAHSRNYGVSKSTSKYVAIFDGDDHVCANWLEAAYFRAVSVGDHSVVHPRMVLTFGASSLIRTQPDQSEEKIEALGLLTVNFWNVCVLASRKIFIETPYVSTGRASGFGFEDWHWNCETIAAGCLHVTAPKTVYFERRKAFGSLNVEHQRYGTIIRSSKLFRAI